VARAALVTTSAEVPRRFKDDREAAARTAALRSDPRTARDRLVPLLGDRTTHLTSGAVLFRAGSAVQALGLLPQERDKPAALLYQAMAVQALGRSPEARQVFAKAVQVLVAPSPEDLSQSAAQRLPWEERVEEEQLRQEAVKLLGPAAPDKP
jgi:hypothetical protein